MLSADTPPGGGTTGTAQSLTLQADAPMSATPADYAVHIFHDVIRTGKYRCFLREDSRLPMIYLPDCIRATVECLEAPPESFKFRYKHIQGFYLSEGAQGKFPPPPPQDDSTSPPKTLHIQC